MLTSSLSWCRVLPHLGSLLVSLLWLGCGQLQLCWPEPKKPNAVCILAMNLISNACILLESQDVKVTVIYMKHVTDWFLCVRTL